MSLVLTGAPRRQDALFDWIARVHRGAWTDVLDAGTGDHSLGWLASLGPRALTGVTIEAWRLEGLKSLAPDARILFGDWTDPLLLAGERFEQVLVDYVIGAIDGHAPYFQYGFLERLRPHCGGAVYLVGLEPQPRDGSVLDEVCRTRDACILMAGDRTYREYPRDLVCEWLGKAGYRVRDATTIPNRVGARFINGQLDVARRKLPRFPDPMLAASMDAHITNLRKRALEQGDTVWGADWVIAAEAV